MKWVAIIELTDKIRALRYQAELVFGWMTLINLYLIINLTIYKSTH